mmetsp:Transcript_43071/g.87090  ORF Transcript_43071/g.87090 Transcript_43071/m.87090 type:complete len:89 (+) Transcript_43071:24-290(+)
MAILNIQISNEFPLSTLEPIPRSRRNNISSRIVVCVNQFFYALVPKPATALSVLVSSTDFSSPSSAVETEGLSSSPSASSSPPSGGSR